MSITSIVNLGDAISLVLVVIMFMVFGLANWFPWLNGRQNSGVGLFVFSILIMTGIGISLFMAMEEAIRSGAINPNMNLSYSG